MNWRSLFKEAQTHYKAGNYLRAKEKYLEALALIESPADRVLLLSNLVVCRIKLGGDENLNSALLEAKECISLRQGWSKGYVRLASVYLALGGHSNDACQALQSAIRLDPNNSIARRMLTNELRRDRVESIHSDSIMDEDIDFFEDDADNAPLLSRLVSTLQVYQEWYRTSDENIKTAIKILFIVIVIYIAFGGRFGLDSLLGNATNSNVNLLGNYGQGNAYDRYYSNINNRQRSINHNNDFSSKGLNQDQYYKSIYESRRETHDRNHHHKSGNGFLYLLSTIGMFYALNALGIPVHQTPFGFGMRRIQLGRVNIGVGGGGMNFGFRPRRWF